MRNNELDAYIVFLLTMSQKYDTITHEIYNLTFIIFILLEICLLEPRSDVPVTVVLRNKLCYFWTHRHHDFLLEHQ